MAIADTHVILVSNQPVPSLLPVIDPACRPRRVVLVHAPERSTHAGWLEEALADVVEEIGTFALADAYDPVALRREFTELAAFLDGKLAVNVTGGSKLMGIAATEVFREFGHDIYYVRLRDDSLVWVHPQHRRPVQLAERCDLGRYLAAHGADGEGGDMEPVVGPLRDAALGLLRQRGVGAVAARLRGQLDAFLDTGLDASSYPASRLEPVFNALVMGGLVEWRNGRVRLTGTEARRFFEGLWLEIAVADLVAETAAREACFQDWRRNLVYAARASDAEDVLRNEIDVACLADNTLHLIECKTGFSLQGVEFALYKLEMIRHRVGGLRSRAMLVTPLKLRDIHRRRARAMGIRLVEGPDLHRLPRILDQWLPPWPGGFPDH